MRLRQTFVASAVMLAAALLVGYASHSKSVPPLRPLSQFPLRIDAWIGKPQRLDDQVYRILGVDDYVQATYRSPGSRWVQLYVAFYESQREGDLIHSPKNCMPGGGWNIVQSDVERIDLPAREEAFHAIKLLLQKGEERQMVLYWFQSRGRFIASEYLQKVYLVVDSITRHRTDGSFVRLIAPMGPEEGEEAALKTLKSFAAHLVPILENHLPS